jgi:hypothetical protein
MKARIPHGYSRLDLSCLLTTDHPAHPEWPYHLRIESFPRAQIVPQVIDLGTLAPNPDPLASRVFREVARLETFAADGEEEPLVGVPEVTGELKIRISDNPQTGRIAGRIRKRTYPIDLEVLSPRSGEAVHAGYVTVRAATGNPATASVHWRTRGIVAVTPSSVSFGLVDPGKPPPTRQTVIRSIRGVPFRILKIDPGDPRVNVRVDEEPEGSGRPATEHRLTLSLAGHVDRGKTLQAGTIRIQTDLVGEEECRVHWSLICRSERPRDR